MNKNELKSYKTGKGTDDVSAAILILDMLLNNKPHTAKTVRILLIKNGIDCMIIACYQLLETLRKRGILSKNDKKIYSLISTLVGNAISAP
jgi:hypothetical protein